MPKFSEREVTLQVSSRTVAFLRAESQVDVDDPEFIEMASKVQERMAKMIEFEMLRWVRTGYAGEAFERKPQCMCLIGHVCGLPVA